jgi:uncharacterized membrane protein
VQHLPQHIQKHIQTIAAQEKDFQLRQTRAEKLGHSIGGFIGSLPFVLLHLAWFCLWIVVNTVPDRTVKRFDPFPFPLLALIIAIEGIFLVSFILIRQKRMSRRSDEREHLLLQVMLLAEQEITTLIEIERRKSIHHNLPGIANDRDVQSLSQPTSVDDLTRRLRETFPSE